MKQLDELTRSNVAMLGEQLGPAYEELREHLMSTLAVHGATYKDLVAEEAEAQKHFKLINYMAGLLPEMDVTSSESERKNPLFQAAEFRTKDELRAQNLSQSVLWLVTEVNVFEKKEENYASARRLEVPFYIIGHSYRQGLMLATPNYVNRGLSWAREYSAPIFSGLEGRDDVQLFTPQALWLHRSDGRHHAKQINKMMAGRNKALSPETMKASFDPDSLEFVLKATTEGSLKLKDRSFGNNISRTERRTTRVSSLEMAQHDVLTHLGILSVMFNTTEQYDLALANLINGLEPDYKPKPGTEDGDTKTD